ncbi:MAG: hypothetical protein D6719_00820, partial [Candidatus Dadabacteria bacterium]
MFPPKAQQNSSGEFSQGSLVSYDSDGSTLLAVIRGYTKNKYRLLNQRGRELELQPARLHPLPAKIPSEFSGEGKEAEYLNRLEERAKKASEEIRISEIWEYVLE